MLLGQGDKEKKVEKHYFNYFGLFFSPVSVEDLRTCAAQSLAEYVRGYSAVLWDSLLVPPSALLLS